MKIFKIVLIMALLISCNSKKKHAGIPYVDYSNEYTASEQQQTSNSYTTIDETIDVPFRERNGVKIISVKVNDAIGIDMIFDTGCSGTLISLAEAQYLYEKGVLSESDILGTAESTIADGSIVVNAVIVLRQIVIAEKIVAKNVQATVSSNVQAPLLLGNEVLNRAPQYTIDNVNKVIKFKIK